MKFDDYCARGRHRHGDKFNPEGLAIKFRPFFNSGERIKVHCYGEELTGTVSVTTGWAPVFLLMRTSRAHGSSITLSDRDVIVAVQRGRTYQRIGA